VPAIIAHGGAGAYSPGEEHEAGLKEAVSAGWSILESGGSALDAVVEAIAILEDRPVFQAGYGSALNLKGEIEMDASIMLDDLSTGAVASISAAANPIRAARLVMERTDHVLLAGEGADEFARAMKLPSRDLRTEARVALYEKALERMRNGEDVKFFPKTGDLAVDMGVGTVGAVAVDAAGRIAAGTSTGGPTLKLPGRVGDAAVIGAGTYANENGGVSATGLGEPIMRYVLAKMAVDVLAGVGAREGIETVLEFARSKEVRFGIIGAEENGTLAHGFTTDAMSWATVSDGELATFLTRSDGGDARGDGDGVGKNDGGGSAKGDGDEIGRCDGGGSAKGDGDEIAASEEVPER